MSNSIPPEVAQQIANHIFAGRKIQAIKLHREYSGLDLKGSKDFIESLEVELRAKEPGRFSAAPAGKGCLGMVAILSVGALVAVAMLVMRLHG